MSNNSDMSNVALAAPNPASYQGTYWLALALTPGLGPTRIKKLIEHYGTAERVFHASLTELEATGMRAVSAQSLATGKSLELAQQECIKAAEASAKVISLSDPEYPSRLKEIYDPPVVLFVKGSVEVLAQPGIAMVGTRHPTPYGSGMAERLSTDLAARGLVIISGLARGIDTASHRGAVAAKGKTVAVLGTGIDVMYPKENTRLAEQIVALGGALISEFPVGTFPAPQNFPIRNRIISRPQARPYRFHPVNTRVKRDNGRQRFPPSFSTYVLRTFFGPCPSKASAIVHSPIFHLRASMHSAIFVSFHVPRTSLLPARGKR
jgi:DNA protecting protein DprA